LPQEGRLSWTGKLDRCTEKVDRYMDAAQQTKLDRCTEKVDRCMDAAQQTDSNSNYSLVQKNLKMTSSSPPMNPPLISPVISPVNSLVT
jgi:hypothetical protein